MQKQTNERVWWALLSRFEFKERRRERGGLLFVNPRRIRREDRLLGERRNKVGVLEREREEKKKKKLIKGREMGIKQRGW